MVSDNELLVLIYENIQKTLGQIKDSRVVTQTLANRVGEIEASVAKIAEESSNVGERLDAVEGALASLTGTVARKNGEMAEAAADSARALDTLAGTLDRVTNPAILTISRTHKSTKDAVRDLKDVHNRVMDEFELYNIRLAEAENAIAGLRKRRGAVSGDGNDK